MSKAPKKRKSVDITLRILDFEADTLLKAVKAYGETAKEAKTKNVCDDLARLLEHQIRREE